jgi:hypothetical protein
MGDDDDDEDDDLCPRATSPRAAWGPAQAALDARIAVDAVISENRSARRGPRAMRKARQGKK